MTQHYFLRMAVCVLACLWSAAAWAFEPLSYANPSQVRVRSLHLDLKADFAQRSLTGFAELTLNWVDAGARQVDLDTRDLAIVRVHYLDAQERWVNVPFKLDKSDAAIGQALRIALPLQAARLRIYYHTTPAVRALQWLAPSQTLSGKWSLMYSQSKPDHARSWVPLQDTPGVRFTYTARIDAPAGMRVVMGAANDAAANGVGGWRFDMAQPIPSSLLAIAIGEFEPRTLGPRTVVYAEPLRLAAAAFELADTEKMIAAAEALYGPYRWERFDVLVLPPSFPSGSVENPRMAFVSATMLTGDRNLVGLVADALAYSWSGSLAAHAAYVAHRIMESVYGAQAAAMQRQLEHEESDMDGAQGAWLLHNVERRVGRAQFDPFLRSWFDKQAFRSATPAQFIDYLRSKPLGQTPTALSQAEASAWLQDQARPPSAALEPSARFASVDVQREAWLAGSMTTTQLAASSWSALEWMKFLNDIDGKASADQLAELDRSFGLAVTSNHEIAFRFHRAAIRAAYGAARAPLAKFLMGVGRLKFVEPLYAALLAQPQDRAWARTFYASKARPQYHPLTQAAIDALMRSTP